MAPMAPIPRPLISGLHGAAARKSPRGAGRAGLAVAASGFGRPLQKPADFHSALGKPRENRIALRGVGRLHFSSSASIRSRITLSSFHSRRTVSRNGACPAAILDA